jgi:hypothetical protein
LDQSITITTDAAVGTPDSPSFPTKLVLYGHPIGYARYDVDILHSQRCGDDGEPEIEYRTEIVARAILLVLPIEISDQFVGRFEGITGADPAMLLSPSEIGGPLYVSPRYDVRSGNPAKYVVAPTV